MVITSDECWALGAQRQQLGSQVRHLRAAQQQLGAEEVLVEEQLEGLRKAHLEADGARVEAQQVQALVAEESLELQEVLRAKEARNMERRQVEEAFSEAQNYDWRRKEVLEECRMGAEVHQERPICG